MRMQLALAMSLQEASMPPSQPASSPDGGTRAHDQDIEQLAQAEASTKRKTTAVTLDSDSADEATAQPAATSASADPQPAAATGTAAANELVFQLKPKQQRRAHAALSGSEESLQAVFKFVAQGKVTIGIEEFLAVVAKLDLDVGDDMAQAAWELVQDTDLAGPCNRLSSEQFVCFVQTLSAAVR